jgi:hypothetical protein
VVMVGLLVSTSVYIRQLVLSWLVQVLNSKSTKIYEEIYFIIVCCTVSNLVYIL